MIHFVNTENKKPIKSWCEYVEDSAMEQANNLANLPFLFKWLVLAPDCHMGYGMPIGGIAALDGVVSPGIVGFDIGCGMGAIKTSLKASNISKQQLRDIINLQKNKIPVGMNHHSPSSKQFEENIDYFSLNNIFNHNYFPYDKYEIYYDIFGKNNFDSLIEYFAENLGTLGGGNHFSTIEHDENDNIWLMIHSGSRNIGYKIANYYHKIALKLNEKWYSNIPNKDLAFLPADSEEGKNYIKDMNFALKFAEENRKIIMNSFKDSIKEVIEDVTFEDEINIHHNFASLENHYGKNVWVHRKGATSAKKDQLGIIPGSMGTSSYIVKGLGNPESFMSCSHGAGRVMGRKQASNNLTREDCEKSMQGIVYDGFKKLKDRKGKKYLDLGEAPLAYKDIDKVIKSESDLVTPIVKLSPLAVIKG